jgi:hypothetical protein
MKKILRSTAMMAASVASFLPMPDASGAPSKQKKHRTANHPPRSKSAPSGDTGRDEPPKAAAPAPATALAPAATAINFTPALVTPPAPDAAVSQDRYPWKRSIVTTTFWIGEKPAKNNPVPNHASSWDENWARNYGGTDTPDKNDRVDYRPADFIPGQNPFYVALPYNDVQSTGHKPEAAKVIPWFKDDFKGAGKTVCKGRWVAIRFKDRVTYAQWEDCGPFRTDHSNYVFGNERPKPNLNKGAGLDVSPAVRDYLGMNDTDVTDWKFVDFDEVPPGPWSKHGDNNTFVINKRLNDARIAALETKKPAPR